MRYGLCVGSIKYKKLGPRVAVSTKGQKLVVVQRVSGWDRTIAILNLVITAALAFAALWLGYSYNANEQADRERENAREERRDGLTAQLQTETAIARCIQYDIDLSRTERVDENALFRIALAQQISNFAIYCRRIGRPLNTQIVESILNRLATAENRNVELAARRALANIRRERAAPPPTVRERVDAVQALGGRVYAVDGLGRAVPVDPEILRELGLPAPDHPQTGQPQDRFYLGDPQRRGFDIRGVGPRVSRVPIQDEGAAFNSGTAF